MKELIITRQEFFLLTGILLGTDPNKQVFVSIKKGLKTIFVFLFNPNDKEFNIDESYLLLAMGKFTELAEYIKKKGILTKNVDNCIVLKEFQRHEGS